jgi:branched-chain amino acid transport system permease protein
VTAVALFLLYRIVRSPFGKTFQAVRDNPQRSAAVGIDVRRHQLTGMIIAGFFAGVAGSLFVAVEGSVFPELMFWTLSLEILIMCLLGGWFTFFGPLFGAAVMVGLRTFVGIYTEYWTLVLGLVLMAIILALPQGVLGYLAQRMARKMATREAP